MDRPTPINEESPFFENEVIVTKTDLTGRITYANHVFCRVSELDTASALGQQHSLIRHPDMPRAVFKLLWDRIQSGEEIFAFVKNMASSGRYYWVLAHVTPTRSASGDIVGYHSNRRKPKESWIEAVKPIYRDLCSIEQAAASRKDGLADSVAKLEAITQERAGGYDPFIWSLIGGAS
ncbi:PAS domain-containing protein [Yunchengibacter salinarum]|uniref:PAS domain-containing protein n=1 Tax=Yunchengibacter salinarum TaxID=3133399 RepID=UPI0035B675A3